MKEYLSIPDLSEEDKKRFLTMIRILSDEECWIWIGRNPYKHLKTKGYPGFLLGDRQYAAHRVSWKIAHGHIDDTLQVLHTCDNKRCVNPNHLYQGTPSDNMGDIVSRHYNEISYRRRFDKEQILTMQSLRQSGETLDAIAQKFNTKRQTVHYVLKNL